MEMTDAEMDELLGYLDKHGLAATSKAWGMTEEEIYDIYPAMELIDSKNEEEIVSEWEPDYSKTAEYEGVNTDKVKLGSLDIDPALAGMLGGRGQAVKKGASWLANKLFASPALKTNQLTKGGKVGQRIDPGTISKNVAGTGLKPSVKKATTDKYKTMVGNVAKKNATKVAAGTTAAAIVGGAINRGLQGNRNAQGDFTVYDEEALDPPTGPDMVPETVPETMGNQYGYHKQEGQNFWTVNNDDPYWDTHEMGTGDAWSDADAKEEVQELDWSSWFK